MNQINGIILGLVLISGAVFMPAQSFAQVNGQDNPYSSLFELLKYLFSSGNVTVITNSDSILDFNKATIILTSSTTTTDSEGAFISINSVALTEGNSGTKNFVFTITRSGDIAGASSVNFATIDGTAKTSDSDYTLNSGTLDFAATETTKTVTVLVNGDSTLEPDEIFNVNLSTCISCIIVDNQGLGTIIDDDSLLPKITINNATLAEGDSGTKNFVFTVTRSSNLGAISVNYSTADNTATAPTDYTALSTTTLNFGDGGPLSQTITVSVKGDTTIEANETFFVNLTGCVECFIADNQGLGTITNDDSANDGSGNGSGDNDSNKEIICHVPPGNDGKSHTITVSASAVPAHLAHGDSLGKCDKQDDTNEDNETGDNETGDNETGDNESGDNHHDGKFHHGKVTVSSDTSVDSTEKETICHVSPGNGNQSHTITVGKSAVSVHLAHGDHLGTCDKQDSHNDGKESKEQSDKHNDKQNNKQSDKHNDD